MFRSLLVALHFLTRLPLPLREVLLEEVGWSVWAFPIVGVLIGLLLIGAAWLMEKVFPPLVVSALLLALWVAITGGLHLDGFIDCCDALLAARPPEARLNILRDTHVGAFGVIGAVTLLLVKFAALAACLFAGTGAALLLAPTLGRWAMVYALARYPYARAEGLGKPLKEATDLRSLLLATLTPALVLLAIRSWATLLTAGASWLFTVLFARWVQRRIPGFTGDIYGALCETVETIALLAVVAGGKG